jgi:hypothetical protein
MLYPGINCHFYYNTGTFGSKVWALINNIEDLDLGMEMSMAEVKARITTLVTHLPCMLSAPLTFNMIPETALNAPVAGVGVYGTFLGILRTRFYAKTVMEFAVSDGPIAVAGSVWWDMEYYVSKTPLSQKLESHEDLQVECQPAYSANNISIEYATGVFGFSVT